MSQLALPVFNFGTMANIGLTQDPKRIVKYWGEWPFYLKMLAANPLKPPTQLAGEEAGDQGDARDNDSRDRQLAKVNTGEGWESKKVPDRRGRFFRRWGAQCHAWSSNGAITDR